MWVNVARIDTRTRIIEVAERLYAERGINGVSLREIGAEAGQRNTGAVRYHFGSKEGLVDAVLEHRMVSINERRLVLLAGLPDDDLHGLAGAFVYPLSEQLGDPSRPSWYLRFVLQAGLVRGTPASGQLTQPWTRGMKVLRHRFDAALGGLGITGRSRRDRFSLFGGFIAHALADRERTIQHEPHRSLTPRDEFLAHVVDAAAALAAAPLTQHDPQRRTP